MKKLFSEITLISHLKTEQIEVMYQLFANYYECTDFAGFKRDLSKKNYVLIVYNENSQIVGFSTIWHYQTTYQEQKLQVIFSGDTIMANAYWGNSALAFNWIKFAGTLKALNPTLPLYWFIIVKGHRTYRYLPVFSKVFYPHYQQATPSWEQGLMNQLATELFGESYDPLRGIIHFSQSQGHLKQDWATIPINLLSRPEVQFFKQKNPQYDQGDELVCLCHLAEENLKPLSRRLFKEGLLQNNVAVVY
ncbi:MAG TPA: hypothetical protein PLD88_09140 [Candidatus Berkiella sp.]|nr:hypothetical protein [Candidatus Berkiella sp.]